MKGAGIADKVIGKAAASLMVLGEIRQVYADVISQPALALLHNANIEVSMYGWCLSSKTGIKADGVRWKQLAME